eukprot:137062-Chlamydomonas_euryale.AAC.1
MRSEPPHRAGAPRRRANFPTNPAAESVPPCQSCAGRRRRGRGETGLAGVYLRWGRGQRNTTLLEASIGCGAARRRRGAAVRRKPLSAASPCPQPAPARSPFRHMRAGPCGKMPGCGMLNCGMAMRAMQSRA